MGLENGCTLNLTSHCDVIDCDLLLTIVLFHYTDFTDMKYCGHHDQPFNYYLILITILKLYRNHNYHAKVSNFLTLKQKHIYNYNVGNDIT